MKRVDLGSRPVRNRTGLPTSLPRRYHRRGERPSLSEYAEKFPELAEQIHELFPAMVAIEKFGADDDRLALPALPASQAGDRGADPRAAGRLPHPAGDRPRRHGDGLRGNPRITGPACGPEDASLPPVRRRDPAGTVPARGPRRGPAAPHAHRPGLWDRRARRPPLLHHAVHPRARIGRCLARSEAAAAQSESV